MSEYHYICENSSIYGKERSVYIWVPASGSNSWQRGLWIWWERTQGPAYFKELAKKLNISLDEETLRFLNSLFLSSKYTSYPLYHNGINVPIYSHSSSPCIRYVDTYNQFLAHAFYFKDLKYDIDYDEHLRNIDYFNQRDVEISLMQAEYVRSFKIQNKS